MKNYTKRIVACLVSVIITGVFSIMFFNEAVSTEIVASDYIVYHFSLFSIIPFQIFLLFCIRFNKKDNIEANSNLNFSKLSELIKNYKAGVIDVTSFLIINYLAMLIVYSSLYDNINFTVLAYGFMFSVLTLIASVPLIFIYNVFISRNVKMWKIFSVFLALLLISILSYFLMYDNQWFNILLFPALFIKLFHQVLNDAYIGYNIGFISENNIIFMSIIMACFVAITYKLNRNIKNIQI